MKRFEFPVCTENSCEQHLEQRDAAVTEGGLMCSGDRGSGDVSDSSSSNSCIIEETFSPIKAKAA